MNISTRNKRRQAAAQSRMALPRRVAEGFKQLRKQQLLEIARVKLMPGHIFANTDGLLSGGACLSAGAKK